MLSRHGCLDHRLLERLPICVGRLRPEAVVAEPAGQFLCRIMPFPAPVAGRVGAGGVPQPADQSACPGKLVPHPRRHHRVAARHRQPRQGEGQLPALACSVTDDLSGAGPAGGAGQARLNGFQRLGFRRSGRVAD